MRIRIISSVLLCVFFISCKVTPKFELTGTLTGADGKIITLSVYDKDGVNILDTIDIVNGKVDYKKELAEPVLLILGEQGKRGSASFFADNVPYTINGDVDSLTNALVTGGSNYAIYKLANQADDKLREISGELRAKYIEANKSGDTATANAISSEYDAEVVKSEVAKLKIVELNPESPVSAYMIYEQYRHKSLEDIKEGVAKLSLKLDGSTYYMALKERISKLEAVAVGQIAPDFTLADTNGELLKLSDIKGDVILVDFWASWCGPCRRENPNVTALYKDYKDKGFEILGVSLDNKKEAWLKAIEDDHLNWYHVSDLKGWKSAAAQLYAVNSIPHTVLLDSEGKILAKNLRGEELRQLVSELLD